MASRMVESKTPGLFPNPGHHQIPTKGTHPWDKAYGILLSFHTHHSIDLPLLKMRWIYGACHESLKQRGAANNRRLLAWRLTRGTSHQNVNPAPCRPPPAAKHVLYYQGENKDETPFLRASSMSMSMVATDLGETSEAADISILRTKGKMGLGECRAHWPQGSRRWDESPGRARTRCGWGTAGLDCLKTVRQARG